MTERELFSPGHSGCAGCGAAALVPRLVLNALSEVVGDDIIVVNSTGCLEIISSAYPQSSWGVPYIHSLFENAPAVASGVVRALRVKGNDHTLVLVVAGDGATYDIGFGSLSGMLERNEDVLYICYDNEAYMNTGVQRSSATPFGASTTTSQAGKKIPGKQEWKKPIVEIAAAHQIPYAASASIAFYADLRSKLHKAVKIRGARFISIHSSCCIGWGFDSNLAVEVCRLAVETGLWKLFEVENGEFRITREPSFIPVEEYFKLQRRFKHLTKEQIEKIQQHVYEDWARLGVKPKK